jgi:hypothetical protein
MWSRTAWRLGVSCLVVSLAGCGADPPPLDELPLRDTLRADPDVIAALSDAARARLASRLEAARAADDGTDEIGAAREAPAALVTALDLARERRKAEPLLVGLVGEGVAQPLAAGAVAPDGAAPLPSFESASPSHTEALEQRALDGGAGASVRALLAASGARRLVRVVGWPIGAVAMGDGVYVNASWLVAQADAAATGPDGGVASAAASDEPRPATSPAAFAGATSNATASADAGAPPPGGMPPPRQEIRSAPLALYGDPDAGTGPPAPTDSPPVDSCSTFADACASLDTGGCGGSSDDSCDGGGDPNAGDSCSDNSSDGSDSCSNSSDDGTDSCSSTDGSAYAAASICALPRGPRGRGRVGTLAWLLSPLMFLLPRSRR